MQFYIDPSRAQDTWALPDGEVFWADQGDWGYDDNGERCDPDYSECTEENQAGYYWWNCMPGCLPDSEPSGPFTTEEEAIANAREMYGE